MMKNAKITRIELVNGDMLSFTLQPEAGLRDHDFDFETAIGGVLNSVNENGMISVNSFHSETALKVGDVITTDGDVIEADEAEGHLEATTITRSTPDYRDVWAEKNGQKGF